MGGVSVRIRSVVIVAATLLAVVAAVVSVWRAGGDPAPGIEERPQSTSHAPSGTAPDGRSDGDSPAEPVEATPAGEVVTPAATVGELDTSDAGQVAAFFARQFLNPDLASEDLVTEATAVYATPTFATSLLHAQRDVVPDADLSSVRVQVHGSDTGASTTTVDVTVSDRTGRELFELELSRLLPHADHADEAETGYLVSAFTWSEDLAAEGGPAHGVPAPLSAEKQSAMVEESQAAVGALLAYEPSESEAGRAARVGEHFGAEGVAAEVDPLSSRGGRYGMDIHLYSASFATTAEDSGPVVRVAGTWQDRRDAEHRGSFVYDVVWQYGQDSAGEPRLMDVRQPPGATEAPGAAAA